MQHVSTCGTAACVMTIKIIYKTASAMFPSIKASAELRSSALRDIGERREMQTHVTSRTQLSWGSRGRQQLSLLHSVHSADIITRNCSWRSWTQKTSIVCRPGGTFTCKVSQQASSAIGASQKLKDDIREAAGPLNGLDRHVSVLTIILQCCKNSPAVLQEGPQGILHQSI